MDNKQNVLFLCTENSCRSQMAEGLLRHYAVASKFTVQSAGLNPAAEVNPLALEVMHEIGIDISEQHPKNVKEYLGKELVNYLITVCANAEKNCPHSWPGLKQQDHEFWDIDDPAAVDLTAAEKLEKFRKTRDTLRENVLMWLDAHGE